DADGRNLLLRFKEDPRSSATPVYVASARSDPHVRAECLALGAEDFLQKPVDPQQILEALARRPMELPGTERRPGREKHGRIVDRAALARAFETGSTSNRFLALIAARGPGTAAEDAPERLGAAFALCAGDKATSARWNADHLAVLIHEDEMAAACRVIEKTQGNLSEPGQPDIVLSAGVAAVEPETTLEEAIHEAGRLLYLAQTSPGTRIVCDPQKVATPGIRILVAEDDEVAANLLVYRLTREPGFEVTHCSDGTDTLKIARERRFDLVILDVNMPGLNGFDVLGRLRETAEYSNVPIVMLTALGSEKDVVRGFDLGASDYVVKPFSPVELIARVRRLLGGAAGVT
ncbi:MAG: response regulator, partial [Gemmatimonadota bacterium]